MTDEEKQAYCQTKMAQNQQVRLNQDIFVPPPMINPMNNNNNNQGGVQPPFQDPFMMAMGGNMFGQQNPMDFYQGSVAPGFDYVPPVEDNRYDNLIQNFQSTFTPQNPGTVYNAPGGFFGNNQVAPAPVIQAPPPGAQAGFDHVDFNAFPNQGGQQNYYQNPGIPQQNFGVPPPPIPQLQQQHMMNPGIPMQPMNMTPPPPPQYMQDQNNYYNQQQQPQQQYQQQPQQYQPLQQQANNLFNGLNQQLQQNFGGNNQGIQMNNMKGNGFDYQPSAF